MPGRGRFLLGARSPLPSRTPDRASIPNLLRLTAARRRDSVPRPLSSGDGPEGVMDTSHRRSCGGGGGRGSRRRSGGRGHSYGGGPCRGGGGVAHQHPGSEPSDGGGRGGGERGGPGDVPDGGAPGVVGGVVSRKPRECRQASERSHAAGQPLAEAGAGAGGVGGNAGEAGLAAGVLPKAGVAAGPQAGAARLGPYTRGDVRPPSQEGHDVPRPPGASRLTGYFQKSRQRQRSVLPALRLRFRLGKTVFLRKFFGPTGNKSAGGRD